MYGGWSLGRKSCRANLQLVLLVSLRLSECAFPSNSNARRGWALLRALSQVFPVRLGGTLCPRGGMNRKGTNTALESL